jgi:hypothetical protein
MSNPKLLSLFQRLYARTQANDVSWEATETEGVYQVSFSQNTVRIFFRASRKHPGNAEYILTVHNSLGTVIAEVTDESSSDELQDAYALFKQLYEMARGKALGIDDTIDSILDDLEGSDY